ncbi:MAG: GNAT family protein [Christensenella sp.]
MKLRKLQLKDINGILGWMKDSDVNCFFRFDAESVNEDTVAKFITDAQLTSENLHMACVDDNDDYMGTVSLKNIDTVNKNAEYAISFGKTAQGTGAAAYATEEILNIAFNQLNLNRVYLNVLSFNTRAVHFYEKNGFIFEGEFRNHIVLRGMPQNLKWYGILKEEFLKNERG